MLRVAGSEHEAWVKDAVARYEGPLLLFATRLLRDAEAARDVVQDTFLKLCASEFASIDGHLAEWLFTVCRNRALDVLRKENRMTQLRDEQVQRCLSPAAGPLDNALRRDLSSRVLDLSRNTAGQSTREVIRLKFQNGFSYQEISRISGHSVSNVGYLYSCRRSRRSSTSTVRRRSSRGPAPDREESLS